MPSGSGKGRRASGEGTYERLPSGLWRLSVRKDGKRIKGPAMPTKNAAREALNAVLREGKSAAQSLSKWADKWLSEGRYAPTTLDAYRYAVDSLKHDPLGNLKPSRITERDLEEWKRRQKLSPVTVRKRLTLLFQILKAAGNPVKCKLPPKKEGIRRPLAPAEREALKRALAESDDKLRLAALLCWEMGLRRSEACGLKHEDRVGDGVVIRRTVTVTKDAIVVRNQTKTESSAAWVPLPPSLRDVVGKGTGYVLGGKKPYNPKTMTDRFRKLALKYPELRTIPRMGPHALRRTFGQQMLEAGVDAVTAARAMRHDPAMLLKTYAKSREDLMLLGVEKAFPMVPKEPELDSETD